MRISLVGTVHAECGLANAAELEAILGRLKADVVFAEIPLALIDQYLDGSHGTLESTAVGRYCEGRQVKVVPVDLTKPEDKFFRNAEEMFNKVERTSPDYRRLMDRHSLNTRAEGFPYLNSARCSQAWTDIYGEVLATVMWIGDPRLRAIYDVWSDTNASRDVGMLENIDDYCVRHAFTHGVFLVGTAHRHSIVNKVRAQRGTDTSGVTWNSDGLLDELG